MADNIKVTIATVVFNGAATLTETIESVVRQSYSNIEYVIVDGASTDKTLDIIKHFSNQYNFIKVKSEPDKGIYDAMNKALQMATGNFLIFLGSDDTLYNDTVIEEFTNFVTDINNVYYGDVQAKDLKELWFGAFTTEKIIMQNICHQAIFYPKDVYKKFTYNLKYKEFADWDYNLRVWSQHGQYKRIELVVAVYAQTGSTFNNPDKVFLKDRPRLINQYFGSKYGWLLKMQRMKMLLVGKTDLRKVKGLLFPKLR
jgi:glycosyltransferase involved in cell wall biosynthesis